MQTQSYIIYKYIVSLHNHHTIAIYGIAAYVIAITNDSKVYVSWIFISDNAWLEHIAFADCFTTVQTAIARYDAHTHTQNLL